LEWVQEREGEVLEALREVPQALEEAQPVEGEAARRKSKKVTEQLDSMTKVSGL
jgi:hypothetical protein